MEKSNDKDDFIRVFARRLRYFISYKEVTQEQVADAVGVSAATVSYWCKGERVPRMDKIDALCRFFNCTRDDLMMDKEQKPASGITLTTDEMVLIEWYRSAPEHDRDFIRRMMAYGSQTKKGESDTA